MDNKVVDVWECSDLYLATFLSICPEIETRMERRGKRAFWIFKGPDVHGHRERFYLGEARVDPFRYAERLKGWKSIVNGTD